MWGCALVVDFEERITRAIDIGLDNRKLIEQLHEVVEGRIGFAAIHSLDEGQVQLSSPIFVSYEAVDDEVVASVDEFGVYGVGLTEREALGEVQEELWELFQDLDQAAPEELGADLAKTLNALRARIQRDAMDA